MPVVGKGADLEKGSSRRWSEPPYFRVFGDYTTRGPRFYPEEELPWTRLLQQEWRTIRREFEQFVQNGGEFERHFVPDRVEIRGWQGVKLLTARRPYRRALAAFPHTAAVLASIPNLVSASFSILEPGAVLPPHHGDTNLFYRAHLGLIVPGDVEVCGIEVGGERRGWREGEVLVFNDAQRHRVWNLSDRPRVILLCDVLKSEYGGASWKNCARILGTVALLYAQFRVPLLGRLPRPVVRCLHQAISAPFYAYLVLCGWPRWHAPSVEQNSLTPVMGHGSEP